MHLWIVHLSFYIGEYTSTNLPTPGITANILNTFKQPSSFHSKTERWQSDLAWLRLSQVSKRASERAMKCPVLVLWWQSSDMGPPSTILSTSEWEAKVKNPSLCYTGPSEEEDYFVVKALNWTRGIQVTTGISLPLVMTSGDFSVFLLPSA